MQTKIIASGSAILILCAIFWLFGHSFISISVDNSANSPITYSLVDDTGNKTVFTTESASVRRLVPKGNYQITAQIVNGSRIGFVKTHGFLSTAKTSLSLTSEVSRQFVGNNPAPCMYYLAGRLISYECTDTIIHVNIHQPATNSQPTYVTKNTNASFFGLMEGLVRTPLGTILLSQNSDGFDEPGAYYHFARVIGNDINATVSTHRLLGLDTTINYAIKAYQKGFIVYDSGLAHVYYFADFDSPATDLRFVNPDPTLHPIGLATDEKSIAALYSNSDGEDGTSNKKPDKSSVVTYQNSKYITYNFNDKVSSATPCQGKLCLLSNGTFEVYSLDSDQATKTVQLNTVTEVLATAQKLLLVTPSGVINFDATKQTGYYEYVVGNYKICGLQPSDSNYLLCVIDSHNNKSALLIDSTQPNRDNIDKKVTLLEDSSAITGVSPYKQFLFITPKLSSTVPDTNGTFGYDRREVQRSQSTITDLLQKAGVNASYTVINTAL